MPIIMDRTLDAIIDKLNETFAQTQSCKEGHLRITMPMNGIDPGDSLETLTSERSIGQ
ncbi:MAG: hypothetical protein GY696_03715 [Gammaproteobacteria bacterium]|nr:hypothetical protein [Gammaproteobacteria bacterium]